MDHNSAEAMLRSLAFACFLLLCSHHLPSGLAQGLEANEASSSGVNQPGNSSGVLPSNANCDYKREFCPKHDYGPQSAYVPCSNLPLDFVDCEDLIDHQENVTSFELSGKVGCLKFGGQHSKDVQMGSRLCHVISSDIECSGERSFIRDGFPCLRYNGHYFVTTLLFSLLLGFLGMDRFYLGHTGTAIGKMLTIGGVGIWWIVDIILLVTGNLMPEDGSNWMPYA